MKGGLSRWRRRFTLLPSSFILVLSACRTPTYPVPEVSDAAVAAERVALQTRFLLADDERRERLHRVTFPILREAAKLFDRTPRPAMGIVLLSDRAYPEAYRARARELWQIGDEPIVRHVAPDSPAEAAGLRPGDRLVGIGGERLEGGLGVFIDALESRLELDRALPLTVEREGNEIELERHARADRRLPHTTALRFVDQRAGDGSLDRGEPRDDRFLQKRHRTGLRRRA